MKSKKKNRCCSVPLPLDPILHHLAGILIDDLRSFNQLSDKRDAIAKALIVLPLVTKESRDLAKQVKHFGVCVSFEAARLRTSWTTKLFDNLHVDVDPLYGANSGCEISFTSRNSLQAPVVQVKLEVSETAVYLAKETSSKIAKLLHHHDCPDLADAPKCVRVLVGRVRHVAQFVAASLASTDQCRACGRETILYDEDNEDEGEQNYWETAGGLFTTEESLSVCCSVCMDVVVDEVNKACGVSKEELASFDSPRSLCGRKRVTMATRAAFKRNEMVARRQRSTETFRVLTCEEVQEARQRTAVALNVDIGLLLACENAMNMPKFRNKILPPCYFRWRTNRSIFLNTLLKVVKVYGKFAPKHAVVLPHLLHKPRWVDKIMEATVAVFK